MVRNNGFPRKVFTRQKLRNLLRRWVSTGLRAREAEGAWNRVRREDEIADGDREKEKKKEDKKEKFKEQGEAEVHEGKERESHLLNSQGR